MSESKENIPQADVLMGSMRSMGYSFEAALADVIDNSISAGAGCVRVFFPTSSDDDQTVGILDDGTGMDGSELFEAMRYGSSSSELVRRDTDLGRFGLGMKSASLSQCRVLTVVSCSGGDLSAYCWDYNYIRHKKQWLVLSISGRELDGLPFVDRLRQQGRGTLVLWQDFDTIAKSNDGQVYDTLDRLKESVAAHLSLIFHRYLNRPKNKVSMYVNNRQLRGLDPFLEKHAKTTTMKERLFPVVDSSGKEQMIRVKPFILPYLSDMTNKDKALMGGVEEMRTRQGFYVYRNERLIIWGNWFGMTRRGELTKNARIRVDIPNTLDDIWSIDIKKQVATIPKSIRNKLTKLVGDALGISVTKQTHRGRKQKVDEQIDYIWDRMEGRDKCFYYKVNRDSELFRFVKGRISEEDADYVELLVNEIEKCVPTQQIYIDKSNGCITEEEDSHRQDDVFQKAVMLLDYARRSCELPIGQLIDNVMRSEPFCGFKDIKDKLTNHFCNGIE